MAIGTAARRVDVYGLRGVAEQVGEAGSVDFFYEVVQGGVADGLDIDSGSTELVHQGLCGDVVSGVCARKQPARAVVHRLLVSAVRQILPEEGEQRCGQFTDPNCGHGGGCDDVVEGQSGDLSDGDAETVTAVRRCEMRTTNRLLYVI